MMSEIQTRDRIPQIVRAGGPSAQRGAAHPADRGVTGRDIWRIIRRRKWTIILPTVIFVAIAVVGTLFWQWYYPLYTAVAVLEVRASTRTPLDRRMDFLQANIMDRLTAQEKRMVKTEAVLRKAIKEPGISRKPAVSEPSMQPRVLIA